MDVYEVVHSEEELDHDNQSVDEVKEITEQLINAFDLTFLIDQQIEI